MELSFFLAKLLGIYFLLLSVLMLISKDRFEKSVDRIISSEALYAFSGVFALLCGLAIIIGHPIFYLNWQGLITFFGILCIVIGIARFLFPVELQKWSLTAIKNRYWFIFALLIALGLFLTYHGFS